MRILQPLALFACLAFAAPSALAQTRSKPFTYNYLQVDYVRSSYDAIWPGVSDPDTDGWGARFSLESDSDVRLLGSWDELKGDDHKRRDGQVGLGFVSHVNSRVDGKLDLKFLWSESKFESFKQTETGWGIEGGVRALFTDMIEGDLTAEYRDLYEGEFGGHGGLVIHATKNIAIAFYYTYFETQQTYRGGLRFSM